jgi:hypothetical protein
MERNLQLFSFELEVKAVHSSVSNVEDEVRDQIGRAFVAEDNRLFRLSSVGTEDGVTSLVVEVAGASAGDAESDLTQLLKRSFLPVVRGGRVDFSEPLQMIARAFKAGDIVCWTNDYGVKWRGRRVLRSDKPDKWGNRYYLEPNEAHWMYVREQNLAHETLSQVELQAVLPQDGSLRRHCELHPNYLRDISLLIQTRVGGVAARQDHSSRT